MAHKDRIKKFLDAARSNEYIQAYGALHRTDGNKDSFCGLGLMCEVYRKETNKGFWEGSEFFSGETILVDYDEYGYVDKPESSDNGLPVAVQEWYGIKDEYPCNIIHLNDDEHMSLHEIADKVEECLIQQ